jgi:serine/threonine protein kinase
VVGVPGVVPLDEFDPPRLGPYALLGRLGAGGMGTVYLGRRVAGGETGPLVAIKVIRPDIADIAEFRARFTREAQAAQRVHHTYTAAVLDVDTAGSRPYLVTEYIEGPTLDARVRIHGPLTTHQVEWLADAVASALRAIHTAGIVHRDLKPGNILLSPFGARVIDFGIAWAPHTTTLLTHSPIGTPAFMAPEQALGQRATTAADVHAWGAVLLYAATGRLPFGGDTAAIGSDTVPAVIRRVIENTPDLTGLPTTLRPLVARAMAKDPAARPNATELVDNLTPRPDAHNSRPDSPAPPREWSPPPPAGQTPTDLDGDETPDPSDEWPRRTATATSPPPLPPTLTAPAPRRRRARTAVLLAAGAILLVAAIIWALLPTQRSPVPTSSPTPSVRTDLDPTDLRQTDLGQTTRAPTTLVTSAGPSAPWVKMPQAFLGTYTSTDFQSTTVLAAQKVSVTFWGGHVGQVIGQTTYSCGTEPLQLLTVNGWTINVLELPEKTGCGRNTADVTMQSDGNLRYTYAVYDSSLDQDGVQGGGSFSRDR